MYREISKRKKTSFVHIVIIATVALSALSLLSWFKIETYRWVYELALLLGAAAAIYFMLRYNFYQYVYSIVEDVFLVRILLGKKETVVFAVHISDIKDLMVGKDIELTAEKLGITIRQKLYLKRNNESVWGLLYYDRDKKCENIMTFSPTDQLVELLSKNLVDKKNRI